MGSPVQGRVRTVILHTDPGFRTNNLLTLRVNLPSAVYTTDLQRSSFYRDLLDRLAQMPCVVSAGLTMTMPLQPTGNHSWTMFVRGDRPIPPTPEGLPTVAFAYVTPGYFQAPGIPLIRGRAMTEEDNLRAPKAAIVSESLARRVFNDDEPLRKTFRLNNRTTATLQTEVGVVNDLRWEDLKQTQPVVYSPLALGLASLDLRAEAPSGIHKTERNSLPRASRSSTKCQFLPRHSSTENGR